jgi:hypothetical protein
MTITEKRTLRYDFTAVEVHDLSMALAGKNKEIVTLKKQKSSVVSEYTAKINAAEASCNDLSNKVADGYEHRDVDCEVIFNQPDNGKKTIIRKDSNTLVGVEAMTQQDWNKINEENTLFGKDADKEGDDNLLAEANTQEA